VDRCRERGRVGFTLLELLAVLLIGALLMSFVVPNMSVLKSRALRQDAERIVAIADLGRQRAVVTGIPHRMVIDLDNGSYSLEWMTSTGESQTTSQIEDSALQPFSSTVSLEPPARTERDFAPLPGLLGRVEFLDDDVEFAEIETPGGRTNSGETFVIFERDGTSSFTTIVLDDPDGRRLILEILPLADTVRIIDEGA
jgi:prepilin-type N-terminal cleavage/methylation domain-containing protein